MPIDWLQVIVTLNTIGVFGGMIVGIKIVRHLSRVELQIDLMWTHFRRTVLEEKDV